MLGSRLGRRCDALTRYWNGADSHGRLVRRTQPGSEDLVASSGVAGGAVAMGQRGKVLQRFSGLMGGLLK